MAKVEAAGRELRKRARERGEESEEASEAKQRRKGHVWRHEWRCLFFVSGSGALKANEKSEDTIAIVETSSG